MAFPVVLVGGFVSGLLYGWGYGVERPCYGFLMDVLPMLAHMFFSPATGSAGWLAGLVFVAFLVVGAVAFVAVVKRVKSR